MSLVAHGLVGGLVVGGGGATLGGYFGGVSASLRGLGGSSIRGGSWCALQHAHKVCMCVCVCARARVCVRVCVHERVRKTKKMKRKTRCACYITLRCGSPQL